jgi:hypothetical protein
MSPRLVDLNPDLLRLRNEGYTVSVRDGYLVVQDIPYVDHNRVVRRGTFVAELTLSGDRTQPPANHVMRFSGDYPCTHEGHPIEAIRNQSQRQELAPGLSVNHAFSSKPSAGAYKDYYEKIRTYAEILSGYAQVLEPGVSPQVFRTAVSPDTNEVFQYIDTASSRSGIAQLNQKLDTDKIAIIGLGGTGSYLLDLLAKVSVREIHLFDGDKFLQHNAFRAPGAPSKETLENGPSKVDHFKAIYSQMHRGIVAHCCYVENAELEVIKQMDFTFVCIDSGDAKKSILEALQSARKPFIDVGMGIELSGDVLTGMARITSFDGVSGAHIKDHISFSDAKVDNAYSRNIQIAELNSLNAALAIIQWKKLRGYYFDPTPALNTTYVLSTNKLLHDSARSPQLDNEEPS